MDTDISRPRKMKRWKLKAALFLVLTLCGCEPVEYSPYEVPRHTGSSTLTQENVARITARDKAAVGEDFSFAIISDTHSSYDELNLSMAAINRDTTLRFLIVAGDITQFGLEKEYFWFLDILSHLKIPYVCLIGNHDALANGSIIYQRRLGSLNYSFAFRGIKFVCINDNIWEFPFAVPDFSWLEGELASATAGQKLYVVSHIPPSGDQFDEPNKRRYVELMARYHVALSIHGHTHNYSYQANPYGDGVPYLISDNIEKRDYLKVTVTPKGPEISRHFF